MDNFGVFRDIYREADSLAEMAREKGVKSDLREKMLKLSAEMKKTADGLSPNGCVCTSGPNQGCDVGQSCSPE